MATLFEISDDIRALEAILFDLDGEITDPEVEAAIDKWLQENKDNLSDKLDGYAALITERLAISAARNAEAARLKSLVTVDENLVSRMKQRLKLFFEAHDIKKFETLRFKFTVAQNGGVLPLQVNSQWAADPANAPEQFHKIEVRLNTEAIREALQNGEEVDGCVIGERGSHLRIK